MMESNAPALRLMSAADRTAAASAVAFCCFFAKPLQLALTYLFFQDNPKLGTAFNIGVSLLGLYLVILLLIAYGFESRKRIWSRPTMWVLAYATLSGVSLLWSQSESLLHAFGYWIGFAAEIVTVVLILRSGSTGTIAVYALKGYVYASCVLALIAWMAPGTWEFRMGQQDYLHPNVIGNQFAVAALFAFYLGRHFSGARQWNWMGIILVFSLLRTLSKASIVSFLIAGAFYVVRYSKVSLRNQLKVIAVATIMVLLSWGLISAYADVYLEENNVETVTGRTVIWAVTSEIAAERPWLGHGFYSIRSVVPNFGEFEAWHAHNDFLQQFFSYGIVGLLLSLVIYASFYRHLRRSPTSPQLGLASALLVYALLHGLTDANHADLMLPSCMILWFAEWVSDDHMSSIPVVGDR